MSKANPEIYVAIGPETEESHHRGTEKKAGREEWESERERENERESVCARERLVRFVSGFALLIPDARAACGERD